MKLEPTDQQIDEAYQGAMIQHLRPQDRAAVQRVVRRALEVATLGPIDMVLHCPACGLQHIDKPDAGAKERVLDRWPPDAVHKPWANPPHKSHLCQGCGNIWRPADVPTNGVAGIKTRGKNDTWPREPGGRFPDDYEV